MDTAERFMTAAQEGDAGAVLEALKAGAAVDATYRDRTALWWAAQEGHTGVVDVLLASGASVNFVDPEGFTPLKQAVGESHVDVAERLLLRGADVNYRCWSDGGCTALHTAAAYGRLDCIRLLLLYGADRGARNDEGQTPFDTAVECREAEAAELIRSHATA